MIGCMLISLKVVSIAVLFFASSRRSATRLRRRVIGTRFSLRPARTGLRCGFSAAAAGFGSGAAFGQVRFHVFTRDAATHAGAL